MTPAVITMQSASAGILAGGRVIGEVKRSLSEFRRQQRQEGGRSIHLNRVAKVRAHWTCADRAAEEVKLRAEIDAMIEAKRKAGAILSPRRDVEADGLHPVSEELSKEARQSLDTNTDTDHQ